MIRISSDGTAVRSRPTGGLYRYRSINEWLEPILARDEMYFSSKTGLNDPFDLDYGLSVAVNRKVIREKFEHAKRWVETMPEQFRDGYKMSLPYVAQLIPEAFALSEHTYLSWRREHIARGDGFFELRASLKSLADKVGVCCFSTVGDDVLMFSHYADSHRGCCLEFDQFHECNGVKTIFPGLVPAVSQSVTYQNTPSVRYFELTLNEMLMTMCYTKQERWSYEREVRFVRLKGPGTETFDRDALTGITFGCKTTEADQRKVIEWVGKDRSLDYRRAVKEKSGLKIITL